MRRALLPRRFWRPSAPLSNIRSLVRLARPDPSAADPDMARTGATSDRLYI
jgi:hypothetical protein